MHLSSPVTSGLARNQKMFRAAEQSLLILHCDLPAFRASKPKAKLGLKYGLQQLWTVSVINMFFKLHPAWRRREGWRNTQFYLQATQEARRPIPNHARANIYQKKSTQWKTPHTFGEIYESITGTGARVFRFVTSVTLPLQVPKTARESRISCQFVHCLLLYAIAPCSYPPPPHTHTQLSQPLTNYGVW